MNKNLINGVLALFVAINAYQVFTVAPLLLLVFIVGQSLFLGVKSIQHYRGDTQYRLNTDPYLTMEQLVVAAVSSCTLLIAGVFL